MKLPPLPLLLVAFVSPCRAATVDELVPALKHLLYQPNYTWSAATTEGIPESGDHLKTTTLDGQHEVGGYTKVWHSEPDGSLSVTDPSVRTWTTDRDDHFIVHWAVETDRGWMSSNDVRYHALEQSGAYRVIDPEGPPLKDVAIPGPEGTDPLVITRARAGGVGFIGPVEGSAGFWRPDQEVTVFLENIAGVTSPAPGDYQVELTPDGIDRLVNPPKPEIVRRSGVVWRIDNATVKLVIHIRQRVLDSYTFTVAGTWVFGPNRKGLNLRMHRTLTNLGTTRVEVPANIASLLEG